MNQDKQAPAGLGPGAARVEYIARLEDERLADYRDIREADRVGRQGVFLAEGEVVVRVMARRGRFPIRSLFLAESRVEALADAIAALPPGVPVYTGPQAVMNGVVGFDIHRGILAAGDCGPGLDAGELLASLGPGPARVVVLEDILNHDNVGGILRNAAAFGVGAVLLVGATCDPLYRKAIRVSVGASLFVPFARVASASEALSRLRAAGFVSLALTPGVDSVDLRALGSVPRAALLLGSEGPGLSAAALAGAERRVHVAMAPGFDSLNVATTSGIALHALLPAG